MGDLEDAFFKQNVPGQYSKWSTETDGHASPEESDSEDDEYYFAEAPSLPLSTATAAPSAAALKASKGGNTGVKGVISDYLDAKREEQLSAAADRLERLEILNAVVNPAKREVTAAATIQNRPQDEGVESEDDDEFLQQYRSERLKQLNNSRLTYGTYATVSPEEYVDLIDSTDPQSFVAVHLYESSVKESAMLHSALDKVAQIMEHVKFIEVEAYEAKPDLDMICLPVVLIYRGGELVCNVVRFTDGLVDERGGGDCLDVQDVKEKLEELGVTPT
jgi:hypothetical protein